MTPNQGWLYDITSSKHHSDIIMCESRAVVELWTGNYQTIWFDTAMIMSQYKVAIMFAFDGIVCEGVLASRELSFSVSFFQH